MKSGVLNDTEKIYRKIHGIKRKNTIQHIKLQKRHFMLGLTFTIKHFLAYTISPDCQKNDRMDTT